MTTEKNSLRDLVRRTAMLLLAVMTTATVWAYDWSQALKSNIDYCKAGINCVCFGGWIYDNFATQWELGDGIEISAIISNKPNESDDGYEQVRGFAEYLVREDVNNAFSLSGMHGFRAKIDLQLELFQYGIDYGEGEMDERTFYVKIYATVNNGNGDEDILLNSPYTALTVRKNLGDGEYNPYIINSVLDWYACTNAIADNDIGDYFSGCDYQLGDDFDNSLNAVSTMFGTNTRPFTGTFDGNGKMLRVNLSGDLYVAPFAYTDGITIKDLTVYGNISATQYAGGIVGYGGSNALTLENCVCSATISNFQNYAGGLLGWCDDLSLTMKNCLFKGSFAPGSGGKFHPIALKNPEASVAVSTGINMYLNTASPSKSLGNHLIIGTQGFPVSTSQDVDLWIVPVRAADGVIYYSQPGALDLCQGVRGRIMVKGWVLDPDYPSESTYVRVHVYTDADCTNEVKNVLLPANHSRPDVNDTYFVTGSHGFQDFIPISNAGTYYVKFFATNLTGDYNLQQIGDTQEVTVTTGNLRFLKEIMTTYDVDYNPTGWSFKLIRSIWGNDFSHDNEGEGMCFGWLLENSNGFNHDYITDLYISNAPNPVPEELTYNGRTYHLAPYQIFWGSSHDKGSITYNTPGEPIHIYYTRTPFANNRAISNIILNNNSDGAVGINGDASQDCRINYGNFTNPVYLHFTTATTIPPFTHEAPYSYSFGRPLDEEGWKAAECVNGTGIPEEAEYFHFDSASKNQYLVSSKFESGVPMILTFNAKSNASDTRFCIGYSKTGNEISDFTWIEMETGNDWQQLEYEIPTDTKYVAIKYIENTLDLDDFNFEAYYSFLPENLRLSNLTQFAATLTWDVPQTTQPIKEYAYQFKNSNEENWPEEVIVRGNLQSFNVNFTDLADGTSYDFRVRTIYENGNSSKYANISFSTPNMPSPTSLYVSEQTEQAATLSWTAPETEFTLTGYSYQYKKGEDEDWSVPVITTATTATISLDDRARYIFRVKALYGAHESLYKDISFTSFYNLPYTYSFDTPLDEEGWQEVDCHWNTKRLELSNGNKGFFLYLSHNYKKHQYLVSPMLNSSKPVAVSFDYRAWLYSYKCDLQVGYSTTSDEISAFTWGNRINVKSTRETRYEKLFPKETKYIAVKAIFNSDNSTNEIWIDNFRFEEYSNPSISDVTLDDCQENSATLTWTTPQTDMTIEGYGYQYKKFSESSWSDETVVSPNVTTAYLSYLTSCTDYVFRVRAYYPNDQRSLYYPLNFTTALALPYECGFENGMDGLFMVDPFDPSFITGIRDKSPMDGQYSFMFHSTYVPEGPQYLMTKLLPTSGDKKLLFYYKTGGLDFYEYIQLGFSTTSDDVGAFIWDDEIVTTNYETWTRYERVIPANVRYIAIRYNDNRAYSVYIDNLSIEGNSEYEMPGSLTAKDLPFEIATQLTWDAPSTPVTGYAWQYKKAVESTWSALTTTDATTVTLSGLTVNTDYQFRVKAVYADGASNFATVSFKSNGGVASLPYVWGFENGLDGFRLVNNVQESKILQFYIRHEGTHIFRFSATNSNGYNTPDPQYLISPRFDTSSAVRVSFYYAMSSGELYLPAAFQVGYSTTTNDIDAFIFDDRIDVTESGWYRYDGYGPEGTKFVAIKWLPGSYFLLLDDFRFEGTNNLHLADNADNTTVINDKDGMQNSTVFLDDRTVYCDGDWNTICLPFNLGSVSGTPLDGFEVKELDTNNTNNGHKTGFENGTLYLNFKNATGIVAGRPYIVRYTRVAGANASIVNYSAFNGSLGYNGEDHSKLTDGNKNTKWRSTETWKSEGSWYCEFLTSNPVNVTGYTMTTGNDTQSHPDRNPREWKLLAKATRADGWTIIDERNANRNSGDALPTANLASTSYAIADNMQGAYQYFRIEISKSGGEEMQLGELTLQGTIAPSTVANIIDPAFSGVTVSKVSPDERKVTSQDGRITFQGTYASQSFTSADQSILFLGAGNTLYWPEAGATIGAQRAFFQLNGLSAGQVNAARMFFGDEEETQSIGDAARLNNNEERINNKWYTVDGRKLDTKPTKKGLYIHGGRKVVVP